VRADGCRNPAESPLVPQVCGGARGRVEGSIPREHVGSSQAGTELGDQGQASGGEEGWGWKQRVP